MYTQTNFKTKKELKTAIAEGRNVGIFQPNDMFGGSNTPRQGTVAIEGPHYPKPHTWYAEVTLVDGIINTVR